MTGVDSLSELTEAIRKNMPKLLSSAVLKIPLHQRAKFENWLKIELAAALNANGFVVRLEESYLSGNGHTYRADVSATVGDITNLIILKTINTNFRFPDVENHHRPITKNITGIIEDIGKLSCLPARTSGYVLFPVFPVASHDLDRQQQLRLHIDRIKETGVNLIFEDYVPRHPDWGTIWYLGQVV